MKVVVPNEAAGGERRVALTPDSVARLVKAGLEVAVEAGAGAEAGFSDPAYEKAGASVQQDGAGLLASGDTVILAGPVQDPVVEGMREGAMLIGFLSPLNSPELVSRLAERRITGVSMEMVPRITRAQRMDALSSQATVAGYKAVLLAAAASSKFFPMITSAAGTIPPAKVLVLGAGVAGLQALATARRLGAVTWGFDIRPEVKEQVESLGAKWVGIQMEEAVAEGGYAKEVSEEAQKQEHEHLHALVAEADVVITTAQIPGRKAPVLITRDMVEAMKSASVIMDLAAESGGNCELTQAGQEVRHGGVLILGPRNLPGSMPTHASQLYARNVETLLLHMVEDGELALDMEDEINAGCVVTHGGDVVHPRIKAQASA